MRLPGADRDAHKRRRNVERCINRLEQYSIATRYNKTATANRANLLIARIFRWSAH
ncbi:hypothetical protein [Streptomyces fructofermentans]|uniref:hypothetical protein n=1 Tax=Streptomyces fructofermentans TaxID=152141 RepID=UPI0034014C16